MADFLDILKAKYGLVNDRYRALEDATRGSRVYAGVDNIIGTPGKHYAADFESPRYIGTRGQPFVGIDESSMYRIDDRSPLEKATEAFYDIVNLEGIDRVEETLTDKYIGRTSLGGFPVDNPWYSTARWKKERANLALTLLQAALGVKTSDTTIPDSGTGNLETLGFLDDDRSYY